MNPTAPSNAHVPLCYTKESFDLVTAQARHNNTIARLGTKPRGSKPGRAIEKEVEQARIELDAAVAAYCACEAYVDIILGIKRP